MRKHLFLCAAIALFCGQFLSAQMIHHWPLASNLEDAVGDLDGTNNGVSFEMDTQRGEVAYFDGESAYANLPSFVNGLDEITVAIWWRMDESRVWSRLYSFGEGDQTEPKDVMMVIPVSGNNDQYRFTLSDPDGPWYDIDIPQDIIDLELGTWYFSCVVLKPDSIIIYHDRNQVFAESGFSRPFGTLNDSENALGKSFWPDPLWKGALSDLRIYDEGLSKEEVFALYDETVATGVNELRTKQDEPMVYADLNRIRVKLNQGYSDEVVSVYNLAGVLIERKPVPQISSALFNEGLYIVNVSGTRVNFTTKVFVK